jgi:hypothetical protein
MGKEITTIQQISNLAKSIGESSQYSADWFRKTFAVEKDVALQNSATELLKLTMKYSIEHGGK